MYHTAYQEGKEPPSLPYDSALILHNSYRKTSQPHAMISVMLSQQSLKRGTSVASQFSLRCKGCDASSETVLNLASLEQSKPANKLYKISVS